MADSLYRSLQRYDEDLSKSWFASAGRKMREHDGGGPIVTEDNLQVTLSSLDITCAAREYRIIHGSVP
jgi:hypothetical protein